MSKIISKPRKTKRHSKIKVFEPIDDFSDFYSKSNPENDLPPIEGDDKKLPNSLKELILSKQRNQEKKQRALERGYSKPLRSVPEFKQKKGESQRHFIQRVDRTTQAVLAKSRVEEEFDVDIEDNGQLANLNLLSNQRGKSKKAKSLKRLEERKKQKHIKILDRKRTGFEQLKDVVAFGEVVQQPPALSVKPRAANKITNKPGKRELLLKQMLTASASASTSGDTRKVKLTQSVCPAKQVMLNAERERVIQAYRQLKGHIGHKLMIAKPQS